MKKLFVLLISLACVLSLAACKPVGPDKEKSEGVLTHEQYIAAEDGSDVTIEAYVQLVAYNAKYGNANVYLQDADGGYYVYRMPCTDEDAAKLVVGQKVKVNGQKGSWGGEIEVAEGSGQYEVLKGTWTASATDVTALLANEEELIKHQNELVTFKDVEVAASTLDGKDYDFWYGWENTAAAGDNADIYFNVKVNGQVYNVCVETDECPESTDVYKAATELKIGDKVSLEGMLYWYWGANLHVTKISK